MKKWHLVIDVARCEDCNNCFLACKDEHVGNDWPGYACAQPAHGQRWMNVMRRERGQFPVVDVAYRPTPCMQCGNAPCVAASNGACYRRGDGIVIIDPAKARGARQLVAACPYGAIWWNESEEVPQKCTLCAHLLDEGWTKPRCVQACPTGALRVEYLDDAELNRIVAAEGLEALNPEYGTRPGVYYKNLYRYDKCFIAGSLAVARDGTLDCAAGVKVALFKGAKRVEATETDAFGDFRFDWLPENSGEYTLEIDDGNERKKALTVDLKVSTNMGVIVL
ncbi:MAG TPA: 4Fe-4S dicluster domain-containing protein [Negativicutes bacterium]|nr:4Fe-4S dicluster domain-containing protein [Negativicutes bacterium]